MEQYNVTGMSCAACSARVEKAVRAVEGVTACSVNLLTNSMGVEGDADSESIIKAVVDAGYGASHKDNGKLSNNNNSVSETDELKDIETPRIRKRLIASLVFLIPLMYVSMGHMMWGWPVPAFISGNHINAGIYELVLAAIVMVINQKFFVSGFKGIVHRAPNMDTLVALGSMASFIYSTVALFAMSDAFMKGDMVATDKYMNSLYFESAAMILTLITVGKMLEARSKGKTTDALKSLMKLAPKTAILVRDGVEQEVMISSVKVGDLFAVRPGESIPVDGVILEGNSAIDESSLTGESIPVDKNAGDSVSVATINHSGYIVCEATRVGEDTTFSQIIRMVSDAAATKAPIAKIADRVSGVFVPVVMGIAFVTFFVWIFTGHAVGYSLARAVSVLVISCPCALGLATPVAIMVGNGKAARNGIMFKTAVSLEETGKASIIALDKTGTITKGEPRVTALICADEISREKLLESAYALESKSEHPLAGAVVREAADNNTSLKEISDFRVDAGKGIKGLLNGIEYFGGNYGYIRKIASDNEKTGMDRTEIQVAPYLEKGHTPLYFYGADKFLGVIMVADVIKDDSIQAISELKNMGLHVVMLTGDNEKTAAAIGELTGVDEVVAEVRPDGKEQVITALKEHGKVIMVGDGINDAPALTTADIGIAIGTGTDIAIDAADVVVMKSNLSDVAASIRLSRATLMNIKENLFWAFIYNLIGIPLAAGVWIPIFGWTLNPMFGAAAMSLSSFCVVTNALRLNLFKLYDGKKRGHFKNSIGREPILNHNFKKEKENMTVKYTVKGMMCGHCEAHVRSAIEKLEGVLEVVADHNTNTVTVTSEKEIAKADIEAAVTAAGYTME